MFKDELFVNSYAYGVGIFSSKRFAIAMIGFLSLIHSTGCYAPLRSPAIPASCLSDSYRTPIRSFASKLNLASLSVPAKADYLLGPNDTLEVVVAGLSNPGAEERVRPILATVMADGKIRLPLVGEVEVSGKNLSQAQEAIDTAYLTGEILANPKTSISLSEAATFSIPIIGEVISPGVHALLGHENDIPHAIALAGGLTPFSADVVEVHRRLTAEDMTNAAFAGDTEGELIPVPAPVDSLAREPLESQPNIVLKIPLRGGTPMIVDDNQSLLQEYLSLDDVTLRPGDVIVVPRQPDEAFYVVGELNDNNTLNFRVSDLDRRLGNAFLLPKDRDVDVVTAVAMAGYIDPINSPTTVTVHRSIPGRPPMLIRVDLIAARYEWNENVYVQAGDIIYLNPDTAWWMRRTFDRVIPSLITIPYAEGMLRWINPGRGN